MVKIKYEINGRFVDVEVTEEFAAMYKELEKSELLTNRKETRRHQSLDKSLDNGYDIPDDRVNIEATAILDDKIEKLYKAIEKLQPQQKWLIEQVFFLGRPKLEIAHELGVNKQAVSNRINRILTSLKNFLK